MVELIVVAVGGGLGASTRYLVSLWAANKFGASFPYGTLIVNIVGCFIIGAFMTAATERFVVSPYWRLLITVGFVGGLTTFSSFSFETLTLLGEGAHLSAMTNLLANVIIGFFATWMGILFVRII